MLFDFEPSDELMTPIINHGGVNDVNPILTSNISPFDDQDFSSIPSKKTEYTLTTKDNPNENNDGNQQSQDDLFSTFNFPVLSELSRTDFPFDGSTLDGYINQAALPSPPMDVHNPSISDDSTFYAVEDDMTSSTCIWVGEECTIESKLSGDMMVPPSPPLSVASLSPSISKKEVIRKKNISTIERKLRKKDQNKSAAEKYRLKKRTERDELMARHTNLKNQNQELKFETENIKFQLEQFKQLFVDVLQIPVPSITTK